MLRQWIGVWFLVVLLAPCVWGQATNECIPRRPYVNLMGGGTEILVENTPAVVVQKNETRCNFVFFNSGSTTMRCMPQDQGTPTATQGLLFAPLQQLRLTTSSQAQWTCISATGAPTTVTVIEELP